MLIKICPSMMCADFSNLKEEVEKLELAGADMFHIDVMDGKYVPNFALGPQDIKALKSLATIPLDVHLMIENPEKYIELFAKLGCDIIYVHPESTTHIHRTLLQIKAAGKKAGVALNPGTSLAVLDEILNDLNYIMLMAVNPGFAGQDFIPETIDKAKRLKRDILKNNKYKDIKIAIDGSISTKNIPLLFDAGAELFVAGTSGLFKNGQTYKESIDELKKSISK